MSEGELIIELDIDVVVSPTTSNKEIALLYRVFSVIRSAIKVPPYTVDVEQDGAITLYWKHLRTRCYLTYVTPLVSGIILEKGPRIDDVLLDFIPFQISELYHVAKVIEAFVAGGSLEAWAREELRALSFCNAWLTDQYRVSL